MPLFQKHPEPRCAYCALCRTLNDGQVVCPKRGVIAASSSCRAFRYDPLKRVPPRPVKADFGGLKDEDFKLD